MTLTNKIQLLKIFVGVLVILVAHSNLCSAGQKIVVPYTMTDKNNYEGYYYTNLLNLAFSKTAAEYGVVEISVSPEWKAEKRLNAELKQNQLDLLWSPTSAELENDFIPIKFSLLKELNDYHLLLIRPESQDNFLGVQNLADLRGFIGGTSSQWRDAQIFDLNKLPTIKSVGYDNIFKMLAAKRFDYFSRGIYQVKAEVDFYSDLQLVIEKNLMLYYKNEVYFFVSKSKPELARRLKIGLELAVKDGSFDNLFNQIPRFQWATEELKHNNRVLISLSQQ